MATLTWDQTGERFYETGVSKGVLYKDDGYGVAWNGLTSVEEDVTDSIEPIYFDGVKFDEIVTLGDYTAILKAFTYPDEFMYYEGVVEDQKGFYVTAQPKKRFGLSYKTLIGDDVGGTEAHYKIHVLYNLTAIPSSIAYHSVSDSTEPVEFEWNISAVPEELENYRPTSHIVFDSRKIAPELLSDIESILYGDADNDAFLPSLKGLATFIANWERLIIIDNGDGTWTASSPFVDVISMLDDKTFQIVSDTATYLDANTYTISSSDKNEDDIWLPPNP